MYTVTTWKLLGFFPQMGYAGRSPWLRYMINKSFLKHVRKCVDEDSGSHLRRLVSHLVLKRSSTDVILSLSVIRVVVSSQYSSILRMMVP